LPGVSNSKISKPHFEKIYDNENGLKKFKCCGGEILLEYLPNTFISKPSPFKVVNKIKPPFFNTLYTFFKKFKGE